MDEQAVTYSILLILMVIGGIAVVIFYFRFKKQAQRQIKHSKGCVACESAYVEVREGDVHCLDCGYVGHEDAGGVIHFKEINVLHGKPLGRGMKAVVTTAAVIAATSDEMPDDSGSDA